ncbi:glycine-rich cell wall structural protein 2-like [Cryptomeria japonica]|uniref:glycine-rich cell wall structural protein 2-like n=1 Tax=Cryptomeria japonica TaxID=3369 RepID=UPI0027DA2F1F|nr:glycine-rich cell wall structural protein 2-like [Cryptomeria japonica]
MTSGWHSSGQWVALRWRPGGGPEVGRSFGGGECKTGSGSQGGGRMAAGATEVGSGEGQRWGPGRRPGVASATKASSGGGGAAKAIGGSGARVGGAASRWRGGRGPASGGEVEAGWQRSGSRGS